MTHQLEKTANHPGMGAIPRAEGVAFRVWAPNADKVFVTGTFNNWQETAIPLYSEQNGFWSADVPEAKEGDEYRYIIEGPESKLSRIDPYARRVTNSVGNGIIYNPHAFDWSDDHFRLPSWNELVLYH